MKHLKFVMFCFTATCILITTHTVCINNFNTNNIINSTSINPDNNGTLSNSTNMPCIELSELTDLSQRINDLQKKYNNRRVIYYERDLNREHALYTSWKESSTITPAVIFIATFLFCHSYVLLCDLIKIWRRNTPQAHQVELVQRVIAGVL